jgi:hypothetical protein
MKGRWWIMKGKEDKGGNSGRGILGLSNIFILGEGEKNWRGKEKGGISLGLCIYFATILCL